MSRRTESFLSVIAKNFDVLAGPIVSLVYPLYASIRAVESGSIEETRQWLMYWILYSLISIFELTFSRLVEVFPAWGYGKLVLVCWLILPYFKGAAYVYHHFVRPFYMNPEATTRNLLYYPRHNTQITRHDDIITAARKQLDSHQQEMNEEGCWADGRMMFDYR